jgi:peptidoglycan glycosyltransferase
MNRSIVRLASLLLLGFFVVAAAVPYWGLIRAAELTARADNPRHIEAERRWDRGRILDRRGAVLAHTDLDDQGLAQRRYPYPQLAPVLGYWSIRHGTAGIEGAFDDALHGRPLSLQAHLDNWLYHRSPVGHDVVLTVDLALQRVADQALGDVRGAAVLLDARSGAILALASHPTFDPARIEEEFTALKQDPRAPLLNRVTQGRYPPGSTFKTVTLAAALEEGIVRPEQIFEDGDETLFVQGFPIRCDNNPRGVNRFDLAHAYAYSCNLTFARLGLELGTKRFKEYAARFRIGREIPLEIPVTPSQLANNPLIMDPVLLASTAFGQGELLVTPLNMALVAATIANDGIMPRPYLVQRVQTRQGEVLRTTRSEILGVPITQATARKVREMMIISVRDGYARRAHIAGAVVGGKTGTAQLGGEETEPHAWFIGFAQAPDDPDGPVYAVAVIVENGGEGSRVATPIAQQLLEAALAAER